MLSLFLDTELFKLEKSFNNPFENPRLQLINPRNLSAEMVWMGQLLAASPRRRCRDDASISVAAAAATAAADQLMPTALYHLLLICCSCWEMKKKKGTCLSRLTLALFTLHIIDQCRLDSGEPIRAIASTAVIFCTWRGEKKQQPCTNLRHPGKKRPLIPLCWRLGAVCLTGFSVCIKDGKLIKVQQGRRGGGAEQRQVPVW